MGMPLNSDIGKLYPGASVGSSLGFRACSRSSVPTSSQSPEYSSAEQRRRGHRAQEQRLERERPIDAALEKTRPIHRDAGECVLQGGARQREPSFQPKIPAGMLRRIGHEDEMRVPILRQTPPAAKG